MLVFLCDGQGADRRANLSGDKSCDKTLPQASQSCDRQYQIQLCLSPLVSCEDNVLCTGETTLVSTCILGNPN